MDKLEPGNPDQVGYGYEGEFDNEPYSPWWKAQDRDLEWIKREEEKNERNDRTTESPF